MAGTIRDWPMESVKEYLTANGKDIKDLAKRGDKTALAVFRAYHDLVSKYPAGVLAPRGSLEYANLCDALNDYFLREQQAKERIRLAERFHHRVEDEKEGPAKSLIIH